MKFKRLFCILDGCPSRSRDYVHNTREWDGLDHFLILFAIYPTSEAIATTPSKPSQNRIQFAIYPPNHFTSICSKEEAVEESCIFFCSLTRAVICHVNRNSTETRDRNEQQEIRMKSRLMTMTCL